MCHYLAISLSLSGSTCIPIYARKNGYRYRKSTVVSLEYKSLTLVQRDEGVGLKGLYSSRYHPNGYLMHGVHLTEGTGILKL